MENATGGELYKAANKVSTPVVAMWTLLEMSLTEKQPLFQREESFWKHSANSQSSG